MNAYPPGKKRKNFVKISNLSKVTRVLIENECDRS